MSKKYLDTFSRITGTTCGTGAMFLQGKPCAARLSPPPHTSLTAIEGLRGPPGHHKGALGATIANEAAFEFQFLADHRRLKGGD